ATMTAFALVHSAAARATSCACRSAGIRRFNLCRSIMVDALACGPILAPFWPHHRRPATLLFQGLTQPLTAPRKPHNHAVYRLFLGTDGRQIRAANGPPTGRVVLLWNKPRARAGRWRG